MIITKMEGFVKVRESRIARREGRGAVSLSISQCADCEVETGSENQEAQEVTPHATEEQAGGRGAEGGVYFAS